MVDAVAGIAIARPVKCIQLSALAVAMKRRYLSSRERTDPYIAAIVSNRSRQTRVATVATEIAGSLYEPDQSEPGRFV